MNSPQTVPPPPPAAQPVMIVQQAAAYQPLTIGDWIVIRIILAIPLAGLVMLFVWALSSDTHPSKKTYCQSTLVIVGCALALVVVMGIVFGGFAAIMAYISQQQGTHHQ